MLLLQLKIHVFTNIKELILEESVEQLRQIYNVVLEQKVLVLLLNKLWNKCSSLQRSEEHTSELQSRFDLVCRLLLEKKKKQNNYRLYDVIANAKYSIRLQYTT